MGNKEVKVFPFELIKLPTTDDEVIIEPFIEKVKKALESDLQDEKLFGCKIKNCHTHAGSKIHFNSFVEAELLFHNSYYNERFASLTVNYIQNVFKEIRTEDKLDIENILLIGYEKYSELFLTTLRDKINERLKKQQQTIKHCEYCIYETNAIVIDGDRKGETSIRRLKVNEKSEINHILKVESGENNTKENNDSLIFANNNTLCLFIVPINTSLSTMDKMVAKFIDTVKGSGWVEKYLSLITLCFDNEFFDFVDESSKKLELLKDYNKIDDLNGRHYFFIASNKFEYIAGKKIKNFVICKSDSSDASKCVFCFPDKSDKAGLIYETPMFGVNRGSVVPMLKFGHYRELVPIKQTLIQKKDQTDELSKEDVNEKEDVKEEDISINFERVWRLSRFMEYRHVARGDNHFQFYFHTEKFLENEVQLKEGKELICWLEAIAKRRKDHGAQVFDYLVAPRHSTNAQFVYLVNNHVFKNKARIMF